MDPRLEKALDFANYRATIANQKRNLKNRVDTVKIHHTKGGKWIADQTTIAFLKALVDLGTEEAVIEDGKGIPVQVDDIKALLEQLVSTYHSAMNEYIVENTKINKARALKTIMDW